MADLDEMQGVFDGFQNPSDCHFRLQAMLDKCACWDESTLLWCMEGIWYHRKFGDMGFLEVPDITGTRNMFKLNWLDLIAYKKELRALLFRKAFDAC